MFVIRGIRQENGRVDVYVYSPGGETWLAALCERRFKKGGQYGWGSDQRGVVELAQDMLACAIADPEIVDLLDEELADQWLRGLKADRWCYAEFELIRWAMRELANEVIRHREDPRKGGLPCPSEN